MNNRQIYLKITPTGCTIWLSDSKTQWQDKLQTQQEISWMNNHWNNLHRSKYLLKTMTLGKTLQLLKEHMKQSKCTQNEQIQQNATVDAIQSIHETRNCSKCGGNYKKNDKCLWYWILKMWKIESLDQYL